MRGWFDLYLIKRGLACIAISCLFFWILITNLRNYQKFSESQIYGIYYSVYFSVICGFILSIYITKSEFIKNRYCFFDFYGLNKFKLVKFYLTTLSGLVGIIYIIYLFTVTIYIDFVIPFQITQSVIVDHNQYKLRGQNYLLCIPPLISLNDKISRKIFVIGFLKKNIVTYFSIPQNISIEVKNSFFGVMHDPKSIQKR